MKAFTTRWDMLKKLTTPWAILIGLVAGFICFAVILLFGAHRIGHSVWEVVTAVSATLAAVGTIGAVVTAIYLQLYLRHRRRPILQIVGPYEPTSPYLRRAPLRFRETARSAGGQLIPVETLGSMSYQLSIRIKNTGKTIARNASIMITAMGRNKTQGWDVQPNWIETPVRWALDVPADIAGEIPTEERNLVPERPYVFNFGALRTDIPDYFSLNTLVMPGNQDSQYSSGEFCFEVIAFAEGAASVTKYFHIVWSGGSNWDFEEVKRKIEVYLRDDPPWQKSKATSLDS